MCEVVTGAWEYSHSEVFKDCGIVAPATDVSQIVGAHHEGEGVFWLALFEGHQSSDCEMWRWHIQFDVINSYFLIEVTVDGIDGSMIAVLACGFADAVFERILWGNYKIDHIETGLLDHMLDDGEVADMQWIE